MKEYLLEVHLLTDIYNDSLAGYYSKGHHDPSLFVVEVCKAFGDSYPAEWVKYGLRRWAMITGSDGPTPCLCEPRAGTGSRGVFPVTIIELDD